MSCNNKAHDHSQEGETNQTHTHEGETEPHTHEGESEPHTHEGETEPHTHEGESEPHTHEGETEPHIHEEDTPDVNTLEDEGLNLDMSLITTKKLEKQSFTGIIKTTGELLPDRNDEIVITAPVNGVISFLNSNLMAGLAVSGGRQLFQISGEGLIDNNIKVRYLQAKSEFEKTTANFERAQKLIVDKIISNKDFLQIKMEYEQHSASFENLEKSYNNTGLAIKSPARGYIKEVYVKEGEYIEQGQVIASIIKNRTIIVKAEVPQRYFSELDKITSANFITTYDQKFYNLKELNGKKIATGKTGDLSPYYIPVFFKATNNGKMITGSIIEVFLRTRTIEDCIVIPKSSLLEEQGKFYVYVQEGTEFFHKHYVELGEDDGKNVMVISGIHENDVIAIQGAYHIKLASMSSSLPAHSHSH